MLRHVERFIAQSRNWARAEIAEKLPTAYGNGHTSDTDQARVRARNTGKKSQENVQRYCISSHGVASETTDRPSSHLNSTPEAFGGYPSNLVPQP
jgi:hypothetical protein